MSEITIRFDIRLARRTIQGTLAAAMVLAAAAELGSEAVTLTTYYPAPSGVYTQMITTGNTFLARDGAAFKVGIGTILPAAKLDVTGNVKIADGTQGLGKVLTSDANGLAAWQVPSLPVKAPASCTPPRHAKGYGCSITVDSYGQYDVTCNGGENHGECRGTWRKIFGYYQCGSWPAYGFQVLTSNGSYELHSIGQNANHNNPRTTEHVCSAL